jgi:TolB-like protein
MSVGATGVRSVRSSFSDGLTEEMITQIGRELSADYLLEGSVRGDGDRIRITAQLVETRTEIHLWAETYDRSLGETLNILQRLGLPE